MTLDEMSDEELESLLTKRKEEKFQRYQELHDAYLNYERWIEEWDAAIMEEVDRSKTYTIMCSGLQDSYDGERLKINVKDYHVNIIACFQAIVNRQYDYNTKSHLLFLEDWQKVKEDLQALKLTINFDPSIDEWILKIKKNVHFRISRDDRGMYIEVGRKGQTYAIRDITSCTYDDKHKTPRWKFALTEAWKILVRMQKIEAEKPETEIEWLEDSLTYATAQYTKRLSLDAIASQEESTLKINLNGNPFHEYQNKTVEFAEAQGNRILIGHEMGLGKSPIAIALAERLTERNEGQTILIIVPASLVPNWQRQLNKFTNTTAYRFTGEHPEAFDMMMAVAKKYRYYIINYDILSTVTKVPEMKELNEKGETIITPAVNRKLWVEVINNMLKPDMVIADEVHYIQNVSSNRSDAVRSINAPRWVVLSGTPFTSYAPQLWPVINLLDAEASGGYETFLKYYTVDGKAAKNVEDLRDMMRTLMFRKTKKDVLKELPPISRITREYELTSLARKRYEKAMDEKVMTAIDAWTGEANDTHMISCILAELMYLKQICAEDKIEYIADLACDLYDQSENGHRKVIIFSQFVEHPPMIVQIAKRLGNEAVRFSGQQSPEERLKIVDQFQKDPEIKFLVCSIKAASEGLDITAAGHVIFSDLMWTPASHHQAEARAYGRLSDLHTIDSYYVIADNTIENEIMTLLEGKLNTFNAIIEGTEETRVTHSIAMDLINALKNGRKKR